MQIPVDWLLEGEDWIAYRTRRDVLNQPESDPAVQTARVAMLASPLVQKLLAELAGWPGTVLASHKSASQPFHKLTFLAELGLRAADPGVNGIVERILEQASPEGPFRLPMNIAEHYGGTGQDQWGWALCDAPLIVSALLRLGYEHEPAVQKALQYLTGLVRENGWPCVVSKELGSFRGPGRKADPCPFATLAMLKALAAAEDSLRDGPAARTGAETLLSLWTQSETQHPYMFFMGTDFRKLKVPFVWYDLMHVLDVLSRFPWLRGDPRLHDMLDTMSAKADPQGRFTLESVWTAWKEWEFGQKKAPSRWLTLAAWRIRQCMETAQA
ncbi:hypothetical protein [Levilinea saccharolytica]|uniref:hypothetical protein n=1 Tax=Levilinea saccharolytica TaxID=229921 RepID=UPI00078109C2|nr:hypothetical protein [Levilinea saccharolytica]GAP16563.1 hypothetical protein LSAC_00419 [Levilinea saccharolytica]